MCPIAIPTGATPTLADLTSRVRTDLFDAGQRAGDQPRWLDSDLTRALDRANDRYSTAAPYLKELVPTFPYMRLYALPDDGWFSDAAEYPYGVWPRWYQPTQDRVSPLIQSPPTSGTPTSFAAGGALSAGAYEWAVTFVVPGGGETTPTAVATGTALANQKAVIAIPQGPYGVSDRNIYRGQHNTTSPLTLVGNAGDNVSSTFTDALSDAAIAANKQPPTTNSTQGIAQFELQISDAKLPNGTNANGQDPNYGWIGLRYAAKHQLDANGTTIPERHWDVLTLGAEFFAVYAYLIPTADNFHYVDGQFRDQVDDTKVPTTWLAIGRDLEQRFQARLTDVKQEDNANIAAIGSWGDKPERWDRL